ncbi:Cysteine desulfurase IscS [Buchnera aphidicola (Eriosoma lanigerum)]|uniref:IscS subfamily cysteine desulfurase n=1 Tax=Buchnera aphidicola TaxID=9 RepID=UPI0034648069
MVKKPIYLDYAATTPMEITIAEKMNQYLTLSGTFGNSASRSHVFGWKAEEAVDIARHQIANLIQADPREIIFTSGATEANNLAIKGCVEFYLHKGNHIITSTTEHKSVLDTCRYLESKNNKVTYINPEQNGIIDINKLESAISKKTILISIMHVNNETGVIQPIEKIAQLCDKYEIILHVDMTQSIGKIPINLKKINIGLISFSAHKIYGPKGIGVLYVRKKPRIRITAQIHGGGHERGMRSGTLPVHQIIGMGEACNLVNKNIEIEPIRLNHLKNRLWNGIKDIEAIHLNSNIQFGSPHILNVSFNYVEGESLIMGLKNLAISSGSACTSTSLEPSYVLRALGLKDELAHSSIRFSIGLFTTEEEIDYTIQQIHSSIIRLRELSPLWEMYQSGINLETINWTT